MGQRAATAITPQGGRTSTGLPTRNPATSPPAPIPQPPPLRARQVSPASVAIS